jgi:hypothetical protein
MNEAVLSTEEVQILLNLLENITIMYPLYKHFDIIRAEQEEEGYRLKIMQGEVDFDEQKFHEELPSYSDFLQCLLAAGVIGYANQEVFGEKMKAYRKLSKPIFLSPDTNVLYHRFLTNTAIDLREALLVNVVRDEIEASLNFKYSPSQIAELKKDAKYQSFLLDEFINRRMKRSRLACIALTEYRELRRYAVEIEGVEPSTNDKEQNDLTIVKTLRRFERERAALPVMLTADRQMADLCEAEGIEYFHFSIPHAVKADFCSHSSMLRLIYNLAMVFGVIRLNSVVVFGEFKGKKKIEELKLRFLDDSLWEKFEKHLRICRRLMKLGIQS